MFLTIMGIYLACGLLFFAYVVIANAVLWKNIKEAPYEIFNKLNQKTYTVTLRTMKIGIYPIIWLGWIFVFTGMIWGAIEKHNR